MRPGVVEYMPDTGAERGVWGTAGRTRKGDINKNKTKDYLI